MNYQDLYQQSLASRRIKKAKVRSNKLAFSDLGKVVNGSVREGAFRHFSNILQSFRLQFDSLNEGQIRRRKKEIAAIAAKWNFELPNWF